MMNMKRNIMMETFFGRADAFPFFMPLAYNFELYNKR